MEVIIPFIFYCLLCLVAFVMGHYVGWMECEEHIKQRRKNG